MSIGIKDIAGYVPEGRVRADELQAAFKTERSFLERKTGSFSLARAAPQESVTDMACTAVKALMARHSGLRERVGLLVVVTQTPDGHGLPHVSAKVHGMLALPQDVAAFDISLACSGWVYAISVCRAMMEAEGIEHGIVVTADPYSKILDPADRDTGLLFGDAATATYLSSDAPEWRIGNGLFGTDGSGANALMRREDGRLHMNGRRVFEFSATLVPPTIRRLVERAGLGLGDIDLFVLHQGSRYIVDTIGERLGATDRTPWFAAEVGNTVSSTIPLALSTLDVRPLRRIVVAGFGVGLSWAANILEKST